MGERFGADPTLAANSSYKLSQIGNEIDPPEQWLDQAIEPISVPEVQSALGDFSYSASNVSAHLTDQVGQASGLMGALSGGTGEVDESLAASIQSLGLVPGAPPAPPPTVLSTKKVEEFFEEDESKAPEVRKQDLIDRQTETLEERTNESATEKAIEAVAGEPEEGDLARVPADAKVDALNATTTDIGDIPELGQKPAETPPSAETPPATHTGGTTQPVSDLPHASSQQHVGTPFGGDPFVGAALGSVAVINALQRLFRKLFDSSAPSNPGTSSSPGATGHPGGTPEEFSPVDGPESPPVIDTPGQVEGPSPQGAPPQEAPPPAEEEPPPEVPDFFPDV
jgi:hypothetical protein